MKILILTTLVVSLSACGSTPIDTYKDSSLQFDPVQFFNGNLVAEGFVRNRAGEILRSFTADIKSRWTEGKGVLDEHFVWSDGEEQTRLWQFNLTDSGYAGTAGDVVGRASMVYSGNVINMKYKLDVRLVSGKSTVLKMDDWLVQTSNNSIVNVTDMTKYGFRVGQVILTMRKVE